LSIGSVTAVPSQKVVAKKAASKKPVTKKVPSKKSEVKKPIAKKPVVVRKKEGAKKVIKKPVPAKKPVVPKKPTVSKKPVAKKAPVKKPVAPKKPVVKKVPVAKKVAPPKTKKPQVKISPYIVSKSPSPKIVPPKIIAKKPCVEQSNLPLKEHQIRVVNHIRKYRGLIVSHAVGSGKTLTAVTASQCYLEDNPKGEVIIVTPVSLQENFKKEMRAYGVDPDKDHRYKFFTLAGFATTYQSKDCPANAMLVIDEAHELRTEVKIPKKQTTAKHTSRAAVAIRCAKSVKKVLLLTATTVYNTPYDIANLVAMVKGQDPPTKHYFETKILTNAAEFRQFFSCVLSFYDIPKSEDYPTVNEHWMEIEMSPKYYRAYRDVEQQKSYLFNAANPWRFLTGVRQASNVLEVCDKCKVIVDRFKANPQKTVIYSAFLTFGVKAIQELFTAEGIPFVEVTGKVTKAQRDAAVKKYNSDQVQILFISRAGNLGLDLKKTKILIIFESSWNRPNEEQIIGRAGRFRSHADLPKSERHVDVYHLIITKPKAGRDLNDKIDSADQLLKQKTEKKDVIGKEFLKLLYSLSIEQLKC